MLSDGASWQLRKQGAAPGTGAVGPTDEAGLKPGIKPDRSIVCAACAHIITSEQARILKAGRHQHTCVNPAGYVYRIACFGRAPGCVGVGEFSPEWSWFADHSWQTVCCGACSVHLGWLFQGPQSLFYGLIANRLDESSGADGD